MNVEIRCQWIF